MSKNNIQPVSCQSDVRCRYDIEREINEKSQLINKLEEEVLQLKREDALFSDEEQWYTEEHEEHIVSSKPIKREKFLVGRINWKEEFKDEGTGASIFITRTEIAKK